MSKEKIIEEFEKKLLNLEGDWVAANIPAPYFKQLNKEYVESLLTAQKEQLKKKIEGRKKDPEISWRNKAATSGYNDALDDIISELNHQ